MVELIAAIRQNAELEVRLASAKSKRLAVAEEHRKMLVDLRGDIDDLVKLGAKPKSDLLSVDVELARFDVWLADLKGM